MRASTPRPLGTSLTLGLFKSARWTVPLWPGNTAMAFISDDSPLYLIGGDGCHCFCRLHVSLAALLQHLGDQRGPACLVTGSDAGATVAMEVLVEQDEVAPVLV